MKTAKIKSAQELKHILEKIYTKGYQESDMRVNEMIHHIQTQLLEVIEMGLKCDA
ncbi:Uncharacterised protein [Bacillus freudenreichii]|nr:Uncharacterised protein [Bacillus freudenreichii]